MQADTWGGRGSAMDSHAKHSSYIFSETSLHRSTMLLHRTRSSRKVLRALQQLSSSFFNHFHKNQVDLNFHHFQDRKVFCQMFFLRKFLSKYDVLRARVSKNAKGNEGPSFGQHLISAGRAVFLIGKMHWKTAPRHDESSFGQNVNFRRPVGFSNRKNHRKSASHHIVLFHVKLGIYQNSRNKSSRPTKYCPMQNDSGRSTARHRQRVRRALWKLLGNCVFL